MSRIFLSLCVLWLGFFVQPAMAKGDLTQQAAIEISVGLGNKESKLIFEPDLLKFETGKLYKLTIFNNGPGKHYFSSDSFSRSVYTRKVQVRDVSGQSIAEVKGLIREIEVYPGQRVEWWFVPVVSGSFNDLKCTIQGHAEAGMVGKIIIE